MIATLRRSALGLVLVALWVAPYLLPIHEGQDGAGWYVVFALGMALTILLVWSVIEDLPRLERRGIGITQLPWLLAIVVGVAVLFVDWERWPSTRAMLADWGPLLLPSGVVAVHHAVLDQVGVGVALPALVVLTSRAIGRPIDGSHTHIHRWITGAALFLSLTPPYIGRAKFGQGILFVLSCWTLWVRELPRLEEKRATRKWQIRVAALAIGIAPQFISDERLFSLWGKHDSIGLHIFLFSLVFGGLGLVFVVLCMSAADLLAWTMRRSRSTRARMLALGLACAALTLAFAQVNVQMNTSGESGSVLSPVMSFAIKVVLLGVVASVFSATLSKRLSESLELSMRAISQIRRGNLDVALDESGRDEMAEVSRSFNQMVAQLREAAFLEKINADLRSRSTQLGQALEALRTAQTDLVRAERMASVATLVKGIAHELNNPINYIAGNMAPLVRYCAFLTRVATELSDGRARGTDELRILTRLADGKDLAFVSEDLGRLTSDIGEGARRAQLIITDLQSLTSAAQRGIERIDLHRIVRQTIALLEPRVPPGVQMKAELTPVPTLPARAGQLEQVLVNLSDNALRAVGDCGVVRIYVGSIEGQAVVRVTDDGPGMTAEVRRQAFEPFFTTRSAGDGSGLGLAIVASIVRAHRGTVTLTSEPGKGTEVVLMLPLDADLVTQAELSSD